MNSGGQIEPVPVPVLWDRALLARPPVALLLGILAGLLLERLLPGTLPDLLPGTRFPIRLLLAVPAFGFGNALLRAGRRELGKYGVDPYYHPSPALVTTGPYSLSRNPMYVGVAICTCAVALLANSWWVLAAGLAPFLLYLQLSIIPEHEEELERVFGQRYRRYCQDTPRWLFCFHHRFWR